MANSDLRCRGSNPAAPTGQSVSNAYGIGSRSQRFLDGSGDTGGFAVSLHAAKRSGAVADFQARHGLELDAEVGPETAERLHVARGFSGRGARAGKRRCSCLWQLKFYIKFNCLDHELFGINWPSCGGVLLDRYKLLSYAPQQCTVSPKIYFLSRDKHRMATRVIKLREAEEPAPEMVQEVLSQSKRPELGRFLLQVDRQTKRSYATAEAAEKAGMVIKKGHPIVRVSVYDSVETANKIIELPAGSPPTS